MKNISNTLQVSLIVLTSDCESDTGRVGDIIKEETIFSEQVILMDLDRETIKNTVLQIIKRNSLDYELVKKGSIDDPSRITFRHFIDAQGNITEKNYVYFTENELHINLNDKDISMKELKKIFKEIQVMDNNNLF